MATTHICNKEREIGAILQTLSDIAPAIKEMRQDVNNVQLKLTGISARMDFDYQTKMEKIEMIIARQDIANNRVSKLEEFREVMRPEHKQMLKEINDYDSFKKSLIPEHQRILNVVDDYLNLRKSLVPEHAILIENQKVVIWIKKNPGKALLFGILFVWGIVSAMTFIDIKTIIALFK